LFTGLIEDVGRVKATGSVLVVETRLAGDVHPGESLAVNGMCLSVEKASGNDAFFRVSPESVDRAAPFLRGAHVNLERPMKLEGRLHGHLVTGHVDCTGVVRAVRKQGAFSTVQVSCPACWHSLLVEKGSVAVSGISLTVADLLPGVGFSVAVIPETLSRTHACRWKPGEAVNLEFDIIGKYIQRSIGLANRPGLREKLEQR
jgi:riboflavin synthase